MCLVSVLYQHTHGGLETLLKKIGTVVFRSIEVTDCFPNYFWFSGSGSGLVLGWSVGSTMARFHFHKILRAVYDGSSIDELLLG